MKLYLYFTPCTECKTMMSELIRPIPVLVNPGIGDDHGRFGDDRDIPCRGMKLTRAVGELPGVELRRLPRNRRLDGVFQHSRCGRKQPVRQLTIIVVHVAPLPNFRQERFLCGGSSVEWRGWGSRRGRSVVHAVVPAAAYPEPLVMFRPAEELRKAVDLIVEAPVGEGHDFGLELVEPWRQFGEDHLARLDMRRLVAHARHLVGLRVDRDGRDAGLFEPKILDQLRAGPPVLDQHAAGGKAACHVDDPLLQERVSDDGLRATHTLEVLVFHGTT